jgi:hypothetical protein
MVRDLLRRGCTESCLIENAYGCPVCDRCCLGTCIIHFSKEGALRTLMRIRIMHNA